MFRLIQISALILFPFFSFSQQVLSSAGTTATGSNVQLSWTVGEAVIATFAGSNVMLTQGFHQGKLTVTNLDDRDAGGLEINAYPNPASDRVLVNFERLSHGLCIELFAGDGKRILIQPVRQTTETVNFEPLFPGLYLLKVTGKEGNILQTFKILKAGHLN